MHYEKERQEHNEQDWPSDERIDIIATNGNTGDHYPKANHQNLTVSDKEALNDIDNVVK